MMLVVKNNYFEENLRKTSSVIPQALNHSGYGNRSNIAVGKDMLDARKMSMIWYHLPSSIT